MDAEVAKFFAVGGAIAIGAIAPALSMGIIASKGLESIGRNPETENAVRNTMVLALSFVESLAIFSLVVALILKFVG